jgi:Reductase C-terminal
MNERPLSRLARRLANDGNVWRKRIYLTAGKVIALDCVNSTKDYVQGRVLVLDGRTVAPSTLADATTLLKNE